MRSRSRAFAVPQLADLTAKRLVKLGAALAARRAPEGAPPPAPLTALRIYQLDPEQREAERDTNTLGTLALNAVRRLKNVAAALEELFIESIAFGAPAKQPHPPARTRAAATAAPARAQTTTTTTTTTAATRRF